MSQLDEINQDDYCLAFSEYGGGIYNASDPSKAYAFSVNEISELIFGTKRSNSGLLPPVTRFFTPQQNIFIIEQQPTSKTINYNNKKYEINLPWHCFLVFLDEEILTQENKFKVLDLFLYFNPSVSFTEQSQLFTMPYPITDSFGKVDQYIVDSLNEMLKNTMSDPYLSIIATFLRHGLDKFFDIDMKEASFNEALLQTEFKEECKDFDSFFDLLNKTDLEKLCFITYQPIKITEVNFDILNQKSGNICLRFDHLIGYINSMKKQKFNSLLDLIKSVVKKSVQN